MKMRLPGREKKNSLWWGRKSYRQSSKMCRNSIVLGLASVLLLGTLLCWQINNLLLPVGSGSDDGDSLIEIDIPMDSSTAGIAAILQAEGLIKNAFLFRLYARYRHCDAHFRAGKYQLSPEMPLDEILVRLQQGVVWAGGPRFTVPEGFTVQQIAVLLAKEGLADEEKFLQECRRSRQNSSFEFLAAPPAGVQYILEGYLFPDTYEIQAEATPTEIVEAMLHRFTEVFNADFCRRAAELELSIPEVVTLASLVEREARVPEERPLISAVFHNRLRSDSMPFLQSCATVQYILGEVKPVLTYDDLAIDSPYNTYLYPHLPPGPIASPGQAALAAALYPADVDYLFFVYKEDGSGTHYFSTTLEGHNRYKNLVRQNRQNAHTGK